MPTNKTFHLAITMAGAVSAGAYTAGVIDYLFEVLDKWEMMKEAAREELVTNPDYIPKIPMHDVTIEVLGGASAGGMTACIASLALRRKLHPIQSYSPDDEKGYKNLSYDQMQERKKENVFYNSWVTMLPGDMIEKMLDTSDLTGVTKVNEKTFVSGLNSNFIEKIAEASLTAKRDETLKLQKFVSDDLRTFVTLTNLDGFKKEINFSSGYESKFFTYDHRDVAMFRFGENEVPATDGSIKVGFSDKHNTNLLIDAGIATGAFPIGLAYRTFSRHRRYIENNILLKYLNAGENIKLEDDDVSHNNLYHTTFIDGGTIDNEPFDLTKYLLAYQVNESEAKSFSTSESKVNSSVIMIDPFPSEKRERIEIKKNESPFSILGAVGKLFSTVRTQSMLKAREVEKAVDRTEYSCFMISPRRKEDERVIDGSLAIACGCLAGFGGFLDKSFRKHDFYLGRINCKSFLQKHFVISEGDAKNNEIFDSYFAAGNEQMKDCFIFEEKDKKTKKPKRYLPIIPDVNIIKDDIKALDEESRVRYFTDLYSKLKFPELDEAKFRAKFLKYEKGIKYRIKQIVQSNIKDFSPPALYIGFGLFFGGKKIFEAIYEYVKDELKRWEIIKSNV
jgi:predicted acylesterase/phospholipase RssA